MKSKQNEHENLNSEILSHLLLFLANVNFANLSLSLYNEIMIAHGPHRLMVDSQLYLLIFCRVVSGEGRADLLTNRQRHVYSELKIVSRLLTARHYKLKQIYFKGKSNA